MELEAKSQSGRALGSLLLPLDAASGSTTCSRLSVAHLVYVRAGGFLIAVPADAEVHKCLEELDPSGSTDEAAFYLCSVDCETIRGAPCGASDIELVDLPWEVVGGFYPGNFLKQSRFKDADVVQLGDGSAWRPIRSSIYAAADTWIQSLMDPTTAAEYYTAEEGEAEEEGNQPEVQEPQFLGPGESEDETGLLRQRVAELESMLKTQGVVAAPAAEPPPRPSALRQKTPPMFGNSSPSSLNPAQLQRLQQLAGAPPPRVSFSETRRKELALPVVEQENIYAELEKEVEEVAGADLAMELAGNQQDPLQKILLTQLQQNSILLKRLVAPRHQDPIVGLLSSGSDGASASGSGQGVKGCLAREAFVKTSMDLDQIQLTVRKNALSELGYTPDKEDAALLRKYMERRMPLAEHKTLAYMATLVADGWAVGYASANVELLGILGKMMIFLEQCALDGGKLQLAWLMTGHQEPAWQMLTNHKRRPGLQPFTRLAAPSWVSANIAFLRELDFMETRMASLSKLGAADKPEKEAEPSRPKPKAKSKKGAGKGSKGEADKDPE